MKKTKLTTRLKAFQRNFFEASSLMFLIILYWIDVILSKAQPKIGGVSKLRSVIKRVSDRLDPASSPPTISRMDLIKLTVRNLQQKKSRTYITIGGMTIGIAAIVFLLSIGYGLQKLVVKRVARLEEMRQTEVTAPPRSNLLINESSLKTFASIPDVEMVAPAIALVAKVSYQNSATDMVAYGVTRNYLEQSAIKPIKGEMFLHNEVVWDDSQKDAPAATPVATESATLATTQESEVEVYLESTQWIALREEADPNADIVGYTRDSGQALEATKVNGEEYLINQVLSSNWYQVTVPIWEENGDGYTKKTDDNGVQVQSSGYVPETSLQSAVDESGVAISEEEQVTRNVDISKDVSNQVVVNRSALKVLGLDEQNAVGETFELTFVVTGELLSDRNEKLQSSPLTYEIIGVTPDDNSPVMYVPFIDLRKLGVNNFSQVKLSAVHESRLDEVREHVENMGYNTKSVADTVNQINSLFTTLRFALAVIGTFALSIASLGMFNTLTVSLLERTREVGLMKAMGLRPDEVEELFLAESMIMGSLGGFFGLLSGFLIAKVLEIGISAYTLAKGVGFISIVRVPWFFAVLIILLSFGVGLLTGIFPARRSKRISALNALRYE